MAFNSLAYALFLVAAWIAYWGAPPRWRLDVLLVASYVFYATWSARYAALMFALTVMNYVFGVALSRPAWRRGWLLALFVAADLAVLGLFKYWNFFVDTVTGPLAAAGIPWRLRAADLILPLGISFFTFEFIHYLVDVRRGAVPVHGFRKFHVFAAFFPTQIAGPIKRFQQFVPNLERMRALETADVVAGVRLIALGWIKKVVVADTLAPIADAAFAAASTRSIGTLEAWVGVLAFSFQILMDFSAYTDIARGSARLLGFDIPINFNAPYLARSVSDFWRRWHISLSTWLRDYVFIPLGGSRRGLPATVWALFVTMTIGGLWHGAAWNFVIWGAYWGVVLGVHRAARETGLTTGAGDRSIDLVAWAVTQLLVLIGWVFFRAPAADIGPFLAAMFAPRPVVDAAQLLTNVAAAVIAVVTAVLMAGLLGVAGTRAPWWSFLPGRMQPIGLGVAVAAAVVLAIVVGPATGPKFIYFQF